MADQIQEEVINTINQYERRVRLMDVAVQPLWDQNQLNITVEYEIVGKAIVESFSFILQRPE